MKRLAVGFVLIAAPVPAQELVFDIAPTRDCLADTRFEDRALCAGRAAEACMEANPGGGSTYGMGFCLDQEWRWWDSELNTIYAQLMPLERAGDAANAAGGGLAPARAEALRRMQRAWIDWRDASCAYVGTQWDGGTGAGPAATACLVDMTARQALALHARSEEISGR
jgi:uncharacterized protein YecT (DUF1311 family)